MNHNACANRPKKFDFVTCGGLPFFSGGFLLLLTDLWKKRELLVLSFCINVKLCHTHLVAYVRVPKKTLLFFLHKKGYAYYGTGRVLCECCAIYNRFLFSVLWYNHGIVTIVPPPLRACWRLVLNRP